MTRPSSSAQRPARPATCLDELEGGAAGAVVGQMQLGVGVDDAHQRDVVETESLGDHLGAEQHRGIGGGEFSRRA